VDSQPKTFSFKREPQAVRAARSALDGLDGRFPRARLYDASLCLSELVSNAVQHPGSGGGLELTVAVDEERLRVEVADEGTGFEPGPPTEGDERGWGLFIVDNLADSWGVEAGERTKVWFEIESARDAEAAAAGGKAESPVSRQDDPMVRAAALRLKGRLAAP
jgi:anti-sigma regulatory factor (Ser/Thr protein kinase)